jgi:hypothetical protein
MVKKKAEPARKRCKRCGLLWPRFAGRICQDCAHQVEFASIVAAARPAREATR